MAFQTMTQKGSAGAKDVAACAVRALVNHLAAFSVEDDDIDVLIESVDDALAALDWARPMTLYLSEIAFTPAQREMIEWAHGAMADFWQDAEEREAEGNAVVDAPIVMTRRGAKIARVRGVLEDLKYRLTEQLPDVVEEEEQQKRDGQIRAAQNAWDKIEAEATELGITNIQSR